MSFITYVRLAGATRCIRTTRFSSTCPSFVATARIDTGSAFTPSFANTEYAYAISSGVTSNDPREIEGYGWRLLCTPIFEASSITFGTPASIAARTAGMLYDIASARLTVGVP